MAHLRTLAAGLQTWEPGLLGQALTHGAGGVR